MEPSPIQEKPKPSWDIKYEKVQERVKESFWGDFIFGGLLISGIFIIVDNLNLPQEINIITGFLIIILAISLMLGRLRRLKRIPHRINKMMYKAKMALVHKNYTKSINYLKRIIRIDKSYSPAWINKGFVLSYLRRYEEAIECFGKGIALTRFKRYKEAIECFDKAIKIDEKDVEVWTGKGVALSRLKRYEEAIECFGKAWYNKAVLESLRDNKEKSINFLKKAIGLDKKYIEMAKTDEDFDNTRNSKEFKELIGE